MPPASKFYMLFTLVIIVPTLKVTAQQNDTTFYSVVHKDTLVGKQLIWKGRQDRIHYIFQYDQSGFKEDLHTIIQKGSNGNVLFHQVNAGDSTSEEQYQVNGRIASWKNSIEKDSVQFNDQIYSPINSTPGESEIVLAAMKKSPDHSVHLLPSGIRMFQIIDEVFVTNNEAVKRKLQLIRFTGYGDGPRYYWFSNDGRFFASASDWLSTVQKGFEKNIALLLRHQSKKESEYYLSLANKVAIPSAQGIAITNCTLFNSQDGSVLPDQTVIVTGKKITQVGLSAKISIPKGYTKIEGKGKFLMAGLWDSHAHFFEFQGPLLLAQGVTNVRDMGNTPAILDLQRKSKKDSIFGPDVTVISGLIDKVGGVPNTGIAIKTLQEGLFAIEKYKKEGYDQIKLYNDIEPGWLEPLATKAHSLNMRVCGHIPPLVTANEAIDKGFDEITHLPFIFKNFLVDTANKSSYTVPRLVPLRGGTIDIQSPQVQTFLQKMKTKNIAIDPTLLLYEELYTHLPGKVSKMFEPVVNYLPADAKRRALSSYYSGGDSSIQRYDATFRNMTKMVKAFYDNGITIVAGSDNLFYSRELEIFSACGIPNNEVLRIATYIPASLYKKEKEFGNIAKGNTANMILIDGNPVKNISDIRKVEITFKNGKAYKAKEILKEYGWKL